MNMEKSIKLDKIQINKLRNNMTPDTFGVIIKNENKPLEICDNNAIYLITHKLHIQIEDGCALAISLNQYSKYIIDTVNRLEAKVEKYFNKYGCIE